MSAAIENLTQYDAIVIGVPPRIEGDRMIAHDRRDQGHSSEVRDGNDIDHYADELPQLLDHLDV